MLHNIKSSLKNSVIYGLGNLSTKVVGLILLPLYAEKLTIAEYGILGILEISSQALLTLFGLCLYQAFFRWYWQKEYLQKQKSIFFTFLIASVVLAFILVLGLSPFSGYFSKLFFGNMSFTWIVFLMIVSSSLEIINAAPNTLIRLQGKPILFTTGNIIKLTVSLSLTILFITRYNKKIEGIYYAQIIGQIIYLIYLSKYTAANIYARFESKILKEMFLFSLPLLISALSVIILNQSDRYILNFIGNLSDVGIYSLGFKMANTIQVFVVTSVNLAVSPLIYKMMDAPNNKRFYSKLLTYYAFGLMFFVIGMSVFGKEVIKVIAENKTYWDSYKIIPVLSFSIAFIAMRDIALTGLIIQKKTAILAKTVIFISLLNIGLNLLLIPHFNTLGSAISSLISQFVFFLIILFYAQKTYPIPYELKKISILFFTAIVLVSLATLSNDLSIILRLLIKTSLIVVFPIILYWFKFYEEAELNAIHGFWQKWKNPSRWKENIANFEWNL